MTALPNDSVPGLDPVAAHRWQRRHHAISPWLHDEVGQRMAERLGWMVNKPQDWGVHLPQASGQDALKAVRAQYPQAREWWPESALAALPKPAWWQLPSRVGFGGFRGAASRPKSLPADATDALDMIWANMLMHTLARPTEVMAQWLRQLKVQGFVMCSGLGPDSLKELREVYARMGWPAPLHNLTDMHDWGDMLVQTGFAEPVMDMERMTLAYEAPGKLVDDLRAWGRNLSTERWPTCRGRGHWHALEQALLEHMPRNANGHMTLTLEIIYGHAVKPAPRAKVSSHTTVSLQDMRAMLKPNV